MLKGAVYSNVFLLLIMSIFFLTRIFKKNYDLKKLRKIIIIYIIFNLISSYLCISDIVDLGMNFMFLFYFTSYLSVSLPASTSAILRQA